MLNEYLTFNKKFKFKLFSTAFQQNYLISNKVLRHNANLPAKNCLFYICLNKQQNTENQQSETKKRPEKIDNDETVKSLFILKS